MNKKELRKIYLQRRANLTVLEKNSFQENIYAQVFDLNIKKVKTVHLFLSLLKFNEIDTKPLIDYFRSKEKQIAISKCNFQNNTLAHFIFNEKTTLATNKFGVLEPVNATLITEQELDLIFVPLLISDLEKYRVGYGKGFYDQFLAKCRTDTLKIGLNFFEPIQKIEDINPFDIALDKVIYPM